MKSKKEFILGRILEEQIYLAAMEDKLRVFREKNREIRKSPSLQLEEARLQRDVQVKTQVYITLKQQNEMTQINSFDNASFVHIIDSSGIPIKRKGPERAKFVIILYVVGLMIAYIVFDSKKVLSSSKRKYKISYLTFNICITFSPIASDDVKPGDSIPIKLNHPGSPNSISSLI